MCFNDNATQIISGGIDNIIKVSATTRLSFHFKQFEYILISRYVFLLMHEEFFFVWNSMFYVQSEKELLVVNPWYILNGCFDFDLKNSRTN